VVSELSGRQNVRMRAEALGLTSSGNEVEILRRIKELESRGFQFEAADGSFEMLIRRAAPGYRPPFELLEFRVIDEKRGPEEAPSQATVKLKVGSAVMHTVAEGAGPVNALDTAIRRALLPHYPQLAEVHLVDYKVRVVDAHLGTAARPRVLIESSRGEEHWSTVGCSENIIEASWLALWDSLELPLLREQDRRAAKAPASSAVAAGV
jgi:2-isopropylmalate synthase